jgi:mono/diheme cytochrome c family protein
MSNKFPSSTREAQVGTSLKRRARGANLLGAMVGLCATIGVCGWARADDAADIRAGRELATEVCSRCHAMPTDVVGTQPPVLSGPPFQEIAKSDRAAPDALWAFLKTAHNSVSHPGNMPSQDLTEQQIRLIYAYVKSLRAAQ